MTNITCENIEMVLEAKGFREALSSEQIFLTPEGKKAIEVLETLEDLKLA
jgi:hypothetical protein